MRHKMCMACNKTFSKEELHDLEFNIVQCIAGQEDTRKMVLKNYPDTAKNYEKNIKRFEKLLEKVRKM